MAQRIGDLHGRVDGEVRSGAGDPGYCQRKIIAQVRLPPCLISSMVEIGRHSQTSRNRVVDWRGCSTAYEGRFAGTLSHPKRV